MAFSLVTLAAGLVLLARRPFLVSQLHWRNRVFRSWSRAVAWIVGMRVNVKGSAPKAPFCLVSNHLSYVDIVLLAAHVDCRFVAKREVRGWPVLGFSARLVDTIFVDRTNRRDTVRVNEVIEQVLRRGEGVVLFAEGTSTRGAAVLPFKPSLLDAPARMNIPVSYASITYRTPDGEIPADRSVCWWGDMTFAGHFFDLLKLPEFHAQLTFGIRPIRDTNRKRLAHTLHQSIANQFEPVVKP